MLSSYLRKYLAVLPDRHRRALEWFDDHAGRSVSWPGSLEDGTLLATKAKGIYKPEWTKYALSVRQSLSGPYPDKAIERRPDGAWTFAYYQEGLDPNALQENYTNQGLLECQRDVVPVGVFIQIETKPGPKYRVIGLALVSGYDMGYFYLEGADVTIVRDSPAATARPPGIEPHLRADSVADVFDPSKIEDARETTLQLIRLRRGQTGFRRTLLAAYGNRCAITGYDALEALEAAHIVPYRGPVTHHPSNGLLLRADIHTLFDLGLIAIDYDLRKVLLRSELKSSKYAALSGGHIDFPTEERLHPSREAVSIHRTRSQLDTR